MNDMQLTLEQFIKSEQLKLDQFRVTWEGEKKKGTEGAFETATKAQWIDEYQSFVELNNLDL